MGKSIRRKRPADVQTKNILNNLVSLQASSFLAIIRTQNGIVVITLIVEIAAEDTDVTTRSCGGALANEKFGLLAIP